MAHRERLMTTEDVLEELELGDENDDLDEPMMPGSDDEFSDCDLDGNEDDDDDITGVPYHLSASASKFWSILPLLLSGHPC